MAMRVVPPVFSITMYDPLAKENKPHTIAARISHVFQICINQFKILWQKTYTVADVQKHFSKMTVENFRHLKLKQMPLFSIENDKIKELLQYCFDNRNTIKVRAEDRVALRNLLLSISAAKDADDYFTRSLIDDNSAVTIFKDSLVLMGSKKDLSQAIASIIHLLTSFQRMPRVINACFTELSQSPNKEAFLNGVTIGQLAEVFAVALRAPADCPFKEDIFPTIMERLKKEPKVARYFVQAMIEASRTLSNDHRPLSYEQWRKLVEYLRPSEILQLLLQAKGNLQKKAAAYIVDNWGTFQEAVLKMGSHLSMSEIEYIVGVAKTLLISTSNNTSIVRADIEDFSTAWQGAARVIPARRNTLQCLLLERAKKLFLTGHAIVLSHTSYDISPEDDSFREELFAHVNMQEILHSKVKLSLRDLRVLPLPVVQQYLTKQKDKAVLLSLGLEIDAVKSALPQYCAVIEEIAKHLNAQIDKKAFSKKELKQLKEVLSYYAKETYKNMPQMCALIAKM